MKAVHWPQLNSAAALCAVMGSIRNSLSEQQSELLQHCGPHQHLHQHICPKQKLQLVAFLLDTSLSLWLSCIKAAMNALPVKELTQPCAEHKEHVNGVGNEAAWAYGLHNQNAKLALRLACVSPRMIACNETAQGGRQCCPVNSILHLHAALKCLLPRGREQHTEVWGPPAGGWGWARPPCRWPRVPWWGAGTGPWRAGGLVAAFAAHWLQCGPAQPAAGTDKPISRLHPNDARYWVSSE